MYKVVAIILAAGYSTRMGEQNKLAVVWKKQPLLCHVMEAALASELAQVVVVTGHEAKIVGALVDPAALIVHNPDFRKGMSSSICVGVSKAIELQADAVIVLLGDMPLVTSHHINQIINTAANAPVGSLVQASAGGVPGNPVLFPQNCFNNLQSLKGDRGAKEIVSRNRPRVISVEIGDAARRDFDTKEAFSLERDA